ARSRAFWPRASCGCDAGRPCVHSQPSLLARKIYKKTLRMALSYPLKRGSVDTRVDSIREPQTGENMNLNVGRELAALQQMSIKDLRDRYAEAFGEGTNANNRAWLIRRIAWRLQALAEGDLSERARRRAAELANDADIRLSPPKIKPVPPE